MNNSEYQKHEELFLQDIAGQLGLLGKPREVFLARFKDENESLTQGQLESKFNLGGTNTVSTYFSKHIYPALKQEGFDTKNWKEALLWLKKEKFPSWLKDIPEYWLDLLTRAQKTDRIHIQVNGQYNGRLDMVLPDEYEGDYKEIPLKSKILYELQLENPAFIIFLVKFTSGKICCLSPSFLTPVNPLNVEGTTTITIPQKGAKYPFLIASGSIGLEQVVALTPKERPEWDWLPSPNDNLFALDKKHIVDVLTYIENDQDCEVLRWQYFITVPASSEES
jgi:hypothetical protein